jgi:hypothetical protein
MKYSLNPRTGKENKAQGTKRYIKKVKGISEK